MFKLIGFLIFWIYVVSVFVGVYFYEKKTLIVFNSIKKYLQVIFYLLLMLGGYILIYVVNIYFKECSALLSALALIVIWRLVYIVFTWLWRVKKNNNSNIDALVLSKNEINWCNTISIAGMFFLGIILAEEERAWEYIEITSMAVAIWLGSYVPIQIIQSNNVVEKIVEEFRSNFSLDKKNRISIIVGSLVLLLFIILNTIKEFAGLTMIFEKIKRGFAIGAFIFVVVAVIILIIQKFFREK